MLVPMLAEALHYYAIPIIPTFLVTFFGACADSQCDLYPIPKESLYFIYSACAAVVWPATWYHAVAGICRRRGH